MGLADGVHLVRDHGTHEVGDIPSALTIFEVTVGGGVAADAVHEHVAVQGLATSGLQESLRLCSLKQPQGRISVCAMILRALGRYKHV